jgi:hypothetical protein
MMALSKALGMDLPALAEMLRSKGRGKDTMLAHITPKEAALLKRRGGSGSVNPDTGLPEFEDSGSYDFSPPEPASPTYDVVNQQGQFTPTQADTGVPVQVGSSYTPGGDAYAPVGPSGNYQSADILNQYGQTTPYTSTGTTMQQAGPAFPTVTSAPSPVAPGVVSPAQQAAATTKPDQPSWTDKLTKAVTDPNTLARLGLTGALGAYGASQARKAGAQTQAATAEQKALAQPYTASGQTMMGQAQRGELTPQSQAALDAAKAQINQGIANRGGVGSQQASNQIATLYQGLLDNQYKYGLNLMNIGDNITLGAIKSGMQLDTQLQATTNNFYAQLASIAAGGSGQMPVAPSLQTQRTV